MAVWEAQTAATAAANAGYRAALRELLLQLADDELVAGHRTSEWLGLAPHIEEDVAFSSIAQDEVGHANLYYGLLQDLGGGDPDAIAFGRVPSEFRNAVLLERANGAGTYLDRPQFDWARSLLRQYIYDVFDGLRLDALQASSYVPLRQATAKIRREEVYHRLHGATWLQRLAAGGANVGLRVQQAAAELWPEVGGLFTLGSQGPRLVELGILPVAAQSWGQAWADQVAADFARCGLDWPGSVPAPDPNLDGRTGRHSADLTALLDTMTEVYRSDPAAHWLPWEGGAGVGGCQLDAVTVWSALATVADPEMPVVSVVELGLVEQVQVEGDWVRVTLLPTFVGCPALAVIRRDVERAVGALPGVAALSVEFVRDPSWTSDRITAAGREKLKTLGIAPPHAGANAFSCSQVAPVQWLEPPACPYCGGMDTQLENLFGPTACRSIYYCSACRNPFEGIKTV